MNLKVQSKLQNMKFKLFWIFTLILISSCRPKIDQIYNLQVLTDSLKFLVNNTYKPGFGDFMSGIQVHHAKLWFAGMEKNWKLADFESKEIRELTFNIQKYNSDRPESNLVGILNPSLDNLQEAIKSKSVILFNKEFISLTNSCNKCHNDVHYSFNVIKIPSSPPFSNQEFKPVTDY
jgi:hypothetical protein